MRILALAALPLALLSAEPRAPEKARTHGYALSGTVARVDAAAKTFVVKAAGGKETALVRTDATKVRGGMLKVGDRVAVRWLERDGKKIATSIRIEPPAVASATPTPQVAPAANPAGSR
jgi:hypothetical protein